MRCNIFICDYVVVFQSPKENSYHIVNVDIHIRHWIWIYLLWPVWLIPAIGLAGFAIVAFAQDTTETVNGVSSFLRGQVR